MPDIPDEYGHSADVREDVRLYSTTSPVVVDMAMYSMKCSVSETKISQAAAIVSLQKKANFHAQPGVRIAQRILFLGWRGPCLREYFRTNVERGGGDGRS